MNNNKKNIFLIFMAAMLAAGCSANNKALVKDEQKTVAEAPQKLMTAIPASATKGAMVNAVAAIVNDDVITIFQIRKEAAPLIREAEKKGALDEKGKSQIRQTVFDRLIEKRLVEQKIKELKITVSEEDIRQAIDDVKRQNNMKSQDILVSALANQGVSFEQYRDQLREQIERLKLVSMEVRSKILVAESEVREHYEANKENFREDEAFRARHIFFRATEKSAPEDVKRVMTTSLMVLAEAKGGKDFIELAKLYSEDPAAKNDGGDLGLFKKGEMLPELEKVIAGMKPGDISELVYTPSGFHIVKLEERRPGKPKPFESIKSELEEAVYKKKSDDRFSQWAKDLRSKATIDIKDIKHLL